MPDTLCRPRPPCSHVAGTIGAVGGNGAGVAGVSWGVKMLSGKVRCGSSLHSAPLLWLNPAAAWR